MWEGWFLGGQGDERRFLLPSCVPKQGRAEGAKARPMLPPGAWTDSQNPAPPSSPPRGWACVCKNVEMCGPSQTTEGSS